jgi:hypothetical protein
MLRAESDRFDQQSLTLPEGAHVGYARALLVEAAAGDGAQKITMWTAPPGAGTPVIWGNDANFAWAFLSAQHPRAHAREALSFRWLHRLLQTTTVATDLSGVFALIVVDKQQKRVLLIGDRLGIQGLHYGFDADGTWRASTHLLWLLLANAHDGSVHEDAFLSHMAFGYGVEPHRDLYAGIDSVSPGGYASFHHARVVRGNYWHAPEPCSSVALRDVAEVVGTLQAGINATVDQQQPFVGLTAGKDSLCLAAVMPPEQSIHTGTLGAPSCADHLQAAAVSSSLGWKHLPGGVCNSSDFWRWADHVAFQSAGLATISYADMSAFVATHVPPGSAFVMGEGGECVRDFFQVAGRSPLDRLVDDYMTPVAYLESTLSRSARAQLSRYPDALVANLRATIEAKDDDHFVAKFYRFQRMTGNFSLRNAVLSTIRPKLSPFLDSQFIDLTYGVSLAEHSGSAIHRRIILHANRDLMPFFDTPVQSQISTQEWPSRVPALAAEFVTRFRRLVDHVEDLLDPSGVLNLCAAMRERPGRSVYHLFRLYSFAAAREVLRVDPASHLRGIQAECRLVVPIPEGRSASGPFADSPVSTTTARHLV